MDAGMAECLHFDFAGLPGVAAKTGVEHLHRPLQTAAAVLLAQALSRMA
jgi:hypothetical protein